MKLVLYNYVIAWLGVKFGINFTSVVVRMAKIARGEAECNLLFSLQHKLILSQNFTPSHAMTD